jgi:polyisoprenoid-binding protein YceI
MTVNSMKKHLVVLASLALAGVVLAATPWKTEPKQSKLSFVGSQAGAEFEGVFQQFTADIQFDPKDLAGSKFNVTIDLKSIDSKDKERDGIIRGADLFATERWPTAHYVANTFTDKGGGKFVGLGKLTIRDVTRDVPIEFTHVIDANGAWLKGGAKLKRLEFGVGQGEWKDTQWVNNDVRVEFALRLQR